MLTGSWDLAVILGLDGRVDEAVPAIERALVLYEQKANLVSGKRARDLLEEINASVSPR
jgi:hypothetical protein